MAAIPARSSQRTAALDASLEVIRSGGPLTLDSAARAAGLTKPGLMYHFPTKVALLSAVVDHHLDALERDLEVLLATRAADVPAESARIAAYLWWAVTYDHDAADLVMFGDPRLRVQMGERWAQRFGPWVEVPEHLPAARRATLNAVRLMADGCWCADANGVLPVSAADRDAVLRCGLDMLAGDDA